MLYLIRTVFTSSVPTYTILLNRPVSVSTGRLGQRCCMIRENEIDGYSTDLANVIRFFYECYNYSSSIFMDVHEHHLGETLFIRTGSFSHGAMFDYHFGETK
jgi:hypothetical protein